MTNNSKVEIMAPVGSFESLRAAIQAGADSVYFGIEQLNMRARSSNNFTLEDLEKITTICDEHRIKTYLTLNTIIYDHDLALMKTIIKAAKDNRISAVIAMDQAAIMYANKIGVPVHISTQINITNIETLEFYAQFADVVVLSREMTLKQIEAICRQVEERQLTGPSGELIRIETFVHGALCMAISGKCYLSLHTHNSSANRGACKQNCRRTYEVKDEEGFEYKIENEYIMSPKDLNVIGFLDKIINAGVRILKIEGRSKGPDYVYTVVTAYREAKEAVLDGTFSQKKVAGWMEDLSNVYNRGFWGGYYLGKKLGEWTDAPGSKAKKKKSFIGTGVKYYGKIGIGEFKLQQGKLKIGDEIIITGPTTGLIQTTVKTIRVEDKDVDFVTANIPFSMPVERKIRPSDKLYLVEKQ